MQEIDHTSNNHERNKSLEVLGIRSKMEAGKGILGDTFTENNIGKQQVR